MISPVLGAFPRAAPSVGAGELLLGILGLPPRRTPSAKEGVDPGSQITPSPHQLRAECSQLHKLLLNYSFSSCARKLPALK